METLSLSTAAAAAAAAASGLGIACYCLRQNSPAASSSSDFAKLRAQLLQQGYCVVPAAIGEEEIQDIARTCHELLDRPENRQFQEDKFTGSLIPLSKHERFAKLIAHRATLGALKQLGFEQPARWLSGFIISKPPGGPSLGWHQDGWYWDEDVAYEQYPVQLFAMYYLTDTKRENGCLRCIPGTHLQEHPLHQILGAAHSTVVDVEVKAGDLVLGDARLLHAAHANNSDRRRTLITMWYMPLYDQFPARMRERIGNLHIHQVGELYKSWSTESVEVVRKLAPDHDQAAEAATKDSYDHNLDYMVRDPGWIKRHPAAEAKWRECVARSANQ